MVQVLFATNRVDAAPIDGIADFGGDPRPDDPSSLVCGTATVDGIDVRAPASGTITAITRNDGGFAEADLQPILRSNNDILVFVHGTANDFRDSITRGAYNKEWLSQARLPGASSEFDVIVFSWPARSYFIANIPGDYADYLHDQSTAAASAYHFGLLLEQLRLLRPRIAAKRGLNLLCHSMGNYMLGYAVEAWFSQAPVPAPPRFQQIVLAAADETATTFGFPVPRRLSCLSALGQAITVYFSNNDAAMALSHLVNGDYRLGYDGPPNTANTTIFPREKFDFVDCTGVNDYISSWFAQPDRSHQYYRQSPTVRQDITTVLAGFAPQRPAYDGTSNVFTLFPQSGVQIVEAGPPVGAAG